MFGVEFDRMFKDISSGSVNLQAPKIASCKWSVSKVVRYLFESSDTSLEFITKKALFLSFVASGRRAEVGLASLRMRHFLTYNNDKTEITIRYCPKL